MRKILISLLFLSACGDATSLAPAITPPEDRAPPVIDVRDPLRGAVQTGDAATIAVRGFVHDDSHVTLRVNGVPTRIAADGSFAATVPATPGITLLHMVATDASHNEGRDTRAVLGGALVDAATPAVDGIVARLDARAVRAGGAALARRLGETDLGDVLARANPLHQSTLPCVGSRADLERLAHRVARLDVSPVHGGLQVDVELADLQLGLRVAFATSCQASRIESVSAAAAAFRLRGVVHLGLAEGRVTVDTTDASAAMDGLRVAPTLLPARVADSLDALLADRLTTLLAGAVAAELPSLLLRGLGAPGDGALELAVQPTRLDLDEGGATLAATSVARAAAGAGAMYLPRAATRPVVDGRSGVAVGIADDAMNQLLATAWAAGLLDRAATVAGDGYDTIELSSRLPPQLTALADGRLRLVVADVDCHLAARPAGAPPRTVARLALTLDTLVEARVVDGRLTLASTLSWIDADRLDGGDPAAAIAGAREAIAAELLRAVGDVAAALPLPAAASAMAVETPGDTLAATGGWLVVSGDVVP